MIKLHEYAAWDAVEIAGLVRRGDVSAVEVIDAGLRAVAATNGHLNAVVHLDEARARAHAEAAAQAEGPLWGVPFLLKDLGAEDAGQPCTGSSRLLADHVADHDAELVRRVQQGDTESFSQLVERYQDRIYTVCLRQLGDRSLAEEVAQDVFLAIYRALQVLLHDESAVSCASEDQ